MKFQSPASYDGLKRGDGIIDFAGVNYFCVQGKKSPSKVDKPTALKAIVEKLRENEGTKIEIKVRRLNNLTGMESDLTLNFKPRKWSGNGLFGCILKTSPVTPPPKTEEDIRRE